MSLWKKTLITIYITLPPVEESTVALLHADNGYLLTSEWVVSQSISKGKITEEMVIGLYGDVLQSDLEHGKTSYCHKSCSTNCKDLIL